MLEDDFLSVYGGKFTDYIEPFFTVIMYEQQIYENYKKNVGNA
jgi:hypothetical protein